MPPHLEKPGIYFINKASSHTFNRLIQAFQHSQCHYLKKGGLISNEKNRKQINFSQPEGSFVLAWVISGNHFPLSHKFLSYCGRYISGLNSAYLFFLHVIRLSSLSFLKLFVQSNFSCYRLSGGAVFQRSITAQVTAFLMASLPACLMLFKATLSQRNLCQEKWEKESPLTSSSSCDREISTEWTWEKKTMKHPVVDMLEIT